MRDTCPRCLGSGTVEVPDGEVPCDGTIRLGPEVVTCYAMRPHPSAPHMAILCERCGGCGGYDEHREGCPMLLLDPDTRPDFPEGWYFWFDGATTVVKTSNEAGRGWRNAYCVRTVPTPG